MSVTAIIVLVLLVGVIVWGVSAYNRLVALRNRFENAFAQIDVQLKRRYDLIPNLVETVKGYLTHERETLEAVTQARTRAQQAEQKAAASPGEPQAMQQLMAAEGALTGALGRLFALQESYPDLKASETAAPGGARLHGEPDRLRPAGVQRRRHAVQHRPRELPDLHHRQRVPLPRGRVLRDSRRDPPGSAQGLLRLTASGRRRTTDDRFAWTDDLEAGTP